MINTKRKNMKCKNTKRKNMKRKNTKRKNTKSRIRSVKIPSVRGGGRGGGHVRRGRGGGQERAALSQVADGMYGCNKSFRLYKFKRFIF